MRLFILILFITCLPRTALSQTAPSVPNDMTLPQALRYVLDNNPGLMAARAELDATKELYPQALAGWRPTIDGKASVYKSHIDNSNFGSADGASTKDISLNIEQPLYRSGRTTAQTSEAQALIAAGEAQLKRIEQTILLSAAQAYMDLIRDRGLYDLRVSNEAYLQQERTATKEKLDAGMLTQTDLKQADARLARAQAEKISAAGQLETSNAAFEKIVGLKPLNALYYPPSTSFISGDITSLITQAETANPDLIAAQHRLEAAEHNIDATFRNHFPQIFAFASYDKQYDPQPGLVDESEVRTIGVRAAIPIYDAGITRSRTRQATSTAEQRRKQIDETRRQIQANLHTQWQIYQSSLAEIASRRLEIDASESARDGVMEEAKLGERTVLDVLDADQELLNSKAALIRARRDEMVARYSLAALLGKLPDL